MQISTYLYVSLNAVLAWQVSHFYVRRWRPTDFSVFLLTSFRCNCHTHQKSYAEQLACTVITRTEFVNRKTGLKKEVSHPRFLWGCNQGGGVLNFPLAPLRVQSSELTTAKATVTFAENQTTDTSSENTNLRTEVACTRWSA